MAAHDLRVEGENLDLNNQTHVSSTFHFVARNKFIPMNLQNNVSISE